MRTEAEILAAARRHGLFSRRRGGSVLRFVPPATTTEGQIDQAIDILAEGLERASGARSR